MPYDPHHDLELARRDARAAAIDRLSLARCACGCLVITGRGKGEAGSSACSCLRAEDLDPGTVRRLELARSWDGRLWSESYRQAG